MSHRFVYHLHTSPRERLPRLPFHGVSKHLAHVHRLITAVCLLIFLTACAPVASPPVATTTPLPASSLEEVTEEASEAPTGGSNEIILATTTSTEDSGLLDFIVPDFEQKYNADVQVVAVGTGEALQLGENGDADVLLVHARAREDEFIEAGYGVNRQDVMYNDFVIVGPASDPAGIQGMTDAVEAVKKIADAEALFISRGDESGTHAKEQSLWAEAGIEPSGTWHQSVGQGMGAVLTIAQEQQAYTLADRGTFLARTAQGYELPVLVEGDPRLYNPYGVILVNPERHPDINAALGNQFIEWLVSPETQEMIGEFGVEQFGQPLFVPDSAAWRDAQAEGVG